MRVLVAFDKFKDALTATRAGAIARRELLCVLPRAEVEVIPLADGGDGFASIVGEALAGETVELAVADALGRRRPARLMIVRGERLPPEACAQLARARPETAGRPPDRLALVELASASGLAQLEANRRDPWRTTTLGTGQLIRAASEMGVDGVIVGLGGSATHDLGFGALSALGFEFLAAAAEADRPPRRLQPPFPVDWSRLERVEGRAFPGLAPVWLVADVRHPLCGPNGAAAVFAPQKGLPQADIERLDRATRGAAELLLQCRERSAAELERPGAGAAGGAGFGLRVGLGAPLLPGFEFVAACLGLDRAIARADWVITGEGRLDRGSLEGKGPGEVLRRAVALGRPAWAFAGRIDGLTAADFGRGVQLHAVSPPELGLEKALAQAPDLLAQAIRRALEQGAPPVRASAAAN